MGRRSWYCYSKLDRPPYTRRKYMRGGPEPKIKIFELGKPGGEFPLKVILEAQDNCQISHNSLEAARIHVNRYLSSNIPLGREGYYYKICVYPHHIIRENKMMTGAGADRVQDGMRHAWGKPVGSAARIRKGQEILMVKTDPENLQIVKDALKRGRHKFPCASKIVITEGKELVL